MESKCHEVRSNFSQQTNGDIFLISPEKKQHLFWFSLEVRHFQRVPEQVCFFLQRSQKSS